MDSSLHVYTVICQGEGEGHRLCTLTLEFRSLIYISDILEWNLHYMSILLSGAQVCPQVCMPSFNMSSFIMIKLNVITHCPGEIMTMDDHGHNVF